MRCFRTCWALAILLSAGGRGMWAQGPAPDASVPMLVNFSGVLTDASGKPLTGATSVTFSLYQNQQGGEPLWGEVQNVQANSEGSFTVTLGAASQGLPMGLFVRDEPRWLEVQAQGQPIPPRIMLMSVPYALKAGDAQTIGGLPPSAFVRAAPNSAFSTASGAQTSFPSTAIPPSASGVTTTGGTKNTLPLWTTSTNIQNSIVTQTGSGNSAKIGINTSSPAATLDIKGSSTVRGVFTLPANGTATATGGKNSEPQAFVSSVFNSTTSAAVPQTFQWQVEPVQNNTSSASGSLNLLFGSGTSAASETGLHIASNGQITFAAGQTFPGTGTGNGTITGITAGAGLTGGGTNGSVSLGIAKAAISNTMLQNPSLTISPGTAMTGGGSVALGGSTTLNLDTTKVPLLAAANTFTGNQTVSGNLSATGLVTGSAFQIGSNLFSYGTYNLGNAFTGFSGSATLTGADNTAVGVGAFTSDTTGSDNTAIGQAALPNNTTGGANTAVGNGALLNNVAGTNNTALGYFPLYLNTTGGNNTAVGYGAGFPVDFSNYTGSNNTFLGISADVSTGNLNNATAIGANSEVGASNALVLGSINGVNGATSNVNVGIGTTTPANPLTVVGNSSTYIPLAIQGSSNFGTWMTLGNSSTSGATWNLISAGGANSEGAGNLVLTDFNSNATVYIHSNLQVDGNVSKGGGSFKIDDPLDPANKYLSHSFVESPDMMNIYNGLVSLGAHGAAWVTMPAYFEALNREFRYQLTSLGRSQPGLYVAREISGNRFQIAGGKPGGRVSWQVTGIRHDAFADAHRIPVEEDKPARERGKYLHPELFGAPEQLAIGAMETARPGTR
jgi:trimeric autotransporter adhesin